VAGDRVVLAVRDPDAYARFRLRQPPVPSSLLFPQPHAQRLPTAPDEWPRTIALGRPPGSALLVLDFDPRDATSPRARLLVPVPAQARVTLGVRVPHPAVRLEVRVNGEQAGEIDAPADAAHLDLSAAPGWKTGWNVLEIRTRPGGLVLDEIRTAGRP
jgi:hypothetical protein